MVTDPVAFSIGPLTIRWYGILIMLGVIAGAYLASWLARRKGENADHLWNMVPIVVFSAIAGARLYWVFLSWETCCASDPMQALNIRGGGISIHGAIAFGALSIWLYCRYYGLRFWRWIDIVVPAMALGQAIGRWGNFTNQEAFGNPTYLPWKIFISLEHRPAAFATSEYFHPTFLYESIYNLAACVFLTWLCLRSDRDRRMRDGDLLWFYLIGYALARFAIETIRTDSLLLGPFKAAHVLSGVLLVVGIAGYLWRHIGWNGEDKVEATPRVEATSEVDPDTDAPATPAHLTGKSVHDRAPRQETTTQEP
jgi:phosphatidylglycerol:prolipoprotein diacylglycerol transferase